MLSKRITQRSVFGIWPKGPQQPLVHNKSGVITLPKGVYAVAFNQRKGKPVVFFDSKNREVGRQTIIKIKKKK